MGGWSQSYDEFGLERDLSRDAVGPDPLLVSNQTLLKNITYRKLGMWVNGSALQKLLKMFHTTILYHKGQKSTVST